MHFKRLAKVDLLPVVSNPHAVKSSRCKIEKLGKTPSLYIDTGEGPRVIGFTEWTAHEATVPNIETWAKEPDYGICIQTREVRGLDIDLSDVRDADRAEEIFCRELGVDRLRFPARVRASSGRRLLAFVVSGLGNGRRAYIKRASFRTPAGLVELLATGQQFVAAGTHPSGDRYEWRNGPPAAWPEISWPDFERTFRALYAQLNGIEGTLRGLGDKEREPTLVHEIDVDDPVAEHLTTSGWPVYSHEGNKLFLLCPWKDGHSVDSGETEAAWLLAGTGRYRNGHFHCLHASCAGRTDGEFLQEVEYRPVEASSFEDLSTQPDPVALYEAIAAQSSPQSKEMVRKAEAPPTRDAIPLPGLIRDNQGRIENGLENVLTCLLAPQAARCWLRFDEFRGELMIAERRYQWRAFADADAGELRIRLKALSFKGEIGKENMRDALTVLAGRERFDSAQEWLMHHVPDWDGVKRLDRFWAAYMQTKDTEYTRELGRYSWTAQAGRILEPGCQVDMVPVLIGPEGLRKTSAIRMLAPSPDFYASFRLELKDEELSRLMRGCLVGELEELRGISARDGDAVKAWITKRFEKWTPKYQEYAATIARRLVLYGTSNDEDFLQAHMGFRRWLPVMILGVINTALIEKDRLQLWAEARDTWLAEGIEWQAVEQLAKAERAQFVSVDPWHDRVARWLDEELDLDTPTPRMSGTLKTEEVLTLCLGFDGAKIGKREQMRAAQILSVLGMVREQRRIQGQNRKVWVDENA